MSFWPSCLAEILIPRKEPKKTTELRKKKPLLTSQLFMETTVSEHEQRVKQGSVEGNKQKGVWN